MLILVIFPIICSSNVIIKYKLLYLWRMHLMSFILTINVKSSCRYVFYLTWSTHPAILEITHGFVHVTFTTLVVSEINTRNLFEIIDERQTFRTHHFLIS